MKTSRRFLTNTQRASNYTVATANIEVHQRKGAIRAVSQGTVSATLNSSEGQMPINMTIEEAEQLAHDLLKAAALRRVATNNS